MKYIKFLLLKYREIILYLLFGFCTTIVNIVVYLICDKIGFSITISTIIAWILSVLFAYISNRSFVFKSKTHSIADITKEVINFFVCRLATGVLDLVIMILFVDIFNFNGLIIKILSNIIVIILNYVLSKLMVF